MLTEQDFDEYQLRLGLPDEGRSVVASIRTSDPARRVQNNPRSITAMYASSKMGSTRQCESGVELAGAYEYDESDDTLEFWDQPQTIRLEFDSLTGRRQVVFHTPDFLVLRSNEVGFEEWKTEEQLEQLAEKYPHRYQRDADGTWRCPPGESWASQRGLYYRLRSSREISSNKLRNLIFLKDYFSPRVSNITDNARQAIITAIKAKPGMTLEELFETTESVASRDDLYQLIAAREVFIDFDRAPLVEPERVLVFVDPQTASAYHQILEISPSTGPTRAPFLELAIGNTAEWNGRIVTILNVGETNVGLLGHDQKFSEMPITTFEMLVKQGRIVAISSGTNQGMNEKVAAILAAASKEDVAKANRRCTLVTRSLRGEELPADNKVTDRTLRRWQVLYRQAEGEYGCGYVGLLPHTRQAGNRESRLPAATLNEMDEFIEKHFDTLKQMRLYEVWALMKNSCDKKGLVFPSLRTFSQRVHEHANLHDITLKRRGRRAAYQYEPAS
ncbi:MAG TPA: TnsA endonuclease N-terminal domain-containing protein, partial [Pyrinomonadaceae bacterium]|nr:TnsA endonuclease N-terminal domain-containing protein [Pyrinomonadaceae bacterium]